MNGKIVVNGAEITVTTIEDKDCMSLTDMRSSAGAYSVVISILSMGFFLLSSM